MSIYDNAGVALIPSGTKASKLYSVLPANGDGDFTHSRGSTATRVNKDGFIESVATNVPRLDYPLSSGVVGDCPHLLLEPSRTNLAQRTEEFDNSYWVKSNATITANQIVSPDGSQTADKYTHGGSSAVNYIYANVGSVTSGNDYTFSVFVKKGTGTFVQLLYGSGAFGTMHQNFDIENGIIGSSSGDATAFINEYPNGWYRIGITDAATSTASGFGFVSLAQSNTASRLNSFTSSDDFYVWGAQFEQGSYPTSYISWDGSGTTTRAADVCNGSGTSAEFNDSEGGLFAEIAALANDGTSRRLSISDGSNNNQVSIIYGSSNSISPTIYSGGSFQMGGSHTLTDQTDTIKVALKYSTNDAALWVNGTEVLTDTSVTTPTGLNQARFEYGGGSNDFYGKCKQLIYFNEALSDSELETLTS